MARPSGQDFPKHKGGNFWKFRKFWKFWKSGKVGAIILEILELSLGGRIVTHPMTDHALRLFVRGHGLSTGGGGGDHIYIYMYIYIYICFDVRRTHTHPSMLYSEESYAPSARQDLNFWWVEAAWRWRLIPEVGFRARVCKL